MTDKADKWFVCSHYTLLFVKMQQHKSDLCIVSYRQGFPKSISTETNQSGSWSRSIELSIAFKAHFLAVVTRFPFTMDLHFQPDHRVSDVWVDLVLLEQRPESIPDSRTLRHQQGWTTVYFERDFFFFSVCERWFKTRINSTFCENKVP